MLGKDLPRFLGDLRRRSTEGGINIGVRKDLAFKGVFWGYFGGFWGRLLTLSGSP